MSKHTPGPWLHEGRCVYALMDAGTYRKGKMEQKNRFYCLMQGDHECPPEEVEANAKLMAMAPEMLGALKKFLEAADFGATVRGSHGWLKESVEFARGVVGRAEG